MQPCLRISPLPLVSPFSRATITEIRKYRLNCMVSSWQVYPYYPRVRWPHNKVCSSDKKGRFSSGQRLANQQTVKQKQQYMNMMPFALVLASDQDQMRTWKAELFWQMSDKCHVPQNSTHVQTGCSFWPGYDEATQANTKTSFLSPTETHLSR